MDDPNGVSIDLTHDCGEKFTVPLAGKDLATLEFTCPGCGAVERFTAEQVAQIEEAYGSAVEDARAMVRKWADDSGGMFKYEDGSDR